MCTGLKETVVVWPACGCVRTNGKFILTSCVFFAICNKEAPYSCLLNHKPWMSVVEEACCCIVNPMAWETFLLSGFTCKCYLLMRSQLLEILTCCARNSVLWPFHRCNLVWLYRHIEFLGCIGKLPGKRQKI